MNRDILTHILELARWAPSGDNTQPWRFELVDPQLIRVHGHDTRDQVLYDFDGHPSQLAHGALLETLRIAASGFGLRSRWTIALGGDDRHPVYDVSLVADPQLVRDPLFPFIETRTVQRRPMATTPLSATQRQALLDAAGPQVTLQWFESRAERLKVAALLWNSAQVRLTCPEAYPVHKAVIEWRARYSKDRIPVQAVGVDPATARLMEWVMQSWDRVAFFNRYLLGTLAPRIQLDLLPAYYCAAHLLLRPRQPPACLLDWVQLGVALQRIWLTATQQGLHLQPQMTPVIFRWYARTGRRFSSVAHLFEQALRLASDFEHMAGASPTDSFAFFARVGVSPAPRSRSLRQDLASLMTE